MFQLYKCILFTGMGSLVAAVTFYGLMAPASFYLSPILNTDEITTHYLLSIIFAVVILYFLAKSFSKNIWEKWIYYLSLLIGFTFSLMAEIPCYKFGSLLCDVGPPPGISALLQYFLFTIIPATILYGISKIFIYLKLKITR